MAVMARETWTDERLDDLAKRMDKGFDETKVEIRDLRSETKAEFQGLRVEMNSRFDKMDARFDSLQRTMIIGFAGIVASAIAAQL